MPVRLVALFLLFTLTVDLASGQWEPDQFLLDKGVKHFRPRSKNIEYNKPRSRVETHGPSSILSQMPTESDQNSLPINVRQPASEKNHEIKLISQMEYLTLSKSKALAFGVGIGSTFEKIHQITLEYHLAPEFQGISQWENLEISYSYLTEVQGLDIMSGLELRQYQWWGPWEQSSRTQHISLISGEIGILFTNQKIFKPILKMSLAPTLQGRLGAGELSGSDFKIELSCAAAMDNLRTLYLALSNDFMRINSDVESEVPFEPSKYLISFGIQTQLPF